jgi:hypothetical protein
MLNTRHFDGGTTRNLLIKKLILIENKHGDLDQRISNKSFMHRSMYRFE